MKSKFECMLLSCEIIQIMKEKEPKTFISGSLKFVRKWIPNSDDSPAHPDSFAKLCQTVPYKLISY